VGAKGTFAPGSSAFETQQLISAPIVTDKGTKFKSKVCFSVHEALQAQQLGQKKETVYNS
jgi:hypothetical protein